MKKFLVLALVAAALPVKGALVAYDGFNYADGTSLQRQGNWLSSSDNDVTIALGSLSVSGLAAPTGNHAVMSGLSGNQYLMGFGEQSGTMYYSLAFSVTDIGTLDQTGTFFAGFRSGAATGTGWGAELWVRRNGDGYNIGVGPRDIGASQWSSTSYAIGQTIFVVGSYVRVNGGPDVVNLWINPSAATFSQGEPAATLTGSPNANDELGTINAFGLYRFDQPHPGSLSIDELRIGTSWGDVTPTDLTPVPEPIKVALSVFGGLVVLTGVVRRQLRRS